MFNLVGFLLAPRASLLARRGAALVSVVLLVACAPGPKPVTDTADPDGDPVCNDLLEPYAANDDGSGGCELLFEFPSAGCNANPVQGVAISGAAEDPGSAIVSWPADCDPAGQPNAPDPTYAIVPSSTDYNGDWVLAVAQFESCLPEGENDTYAGEVATSSQGGVDCAALLAGAGPWTVSVPMHDDGTCGDWLTAGEIEMQLIRGGSPCEVNAMAIPDVSCTPGTAVPLTFIWEEVRDHDNGTFQHATLTPLVMTGPPYSERGWMRKVKVTDWGDATSLKVLGFGERFKVSDTDVIDTTSSIAITSANSPKNLAVGAVAMNAVWSIDGLPSGDATFDLPTVEVDWTCQVDNSNPHFTGVNAPQAYEIRLNELQISGLTASQRILLRLSSSDTVAVHIDGRSDQRIDIPLTSTSGGATFDLNLVTFGGVHMAGSITASGVNRVVTFTDLVVNAVDYGTPSWTFEPVP